MGYIPAYLRWLLQAIAHGFWRVGDGGVEWTIIGEEVKCPGNHISPGDRLVRPWGFRGLPPWQLQLDKHWPVPPKNTKNTRAAAAMFMLKALNTCLDSAMSPQRKSTAFESAGTVPNGKGRIRPLVGH